MAASRRVLAQTFVSELLAAKDAAQKDRLKRSLAAYLIEVKQQKNVEMLLGDIARELAAKGYVATDVVTARPLSEAQRTSVITIVKDATGAKTVELLEEVEPSLIGGIQLKLPGHELDASIQRRLSTLKGYI